MPISPIGHCEDPRVNRSRPWRRIDRPTPAFMVSARAGWRKGRATMAVGKEQVLAALAKVPSPGGAALTDARVLSDIVVTDGKVFFSHHRRCRGGESLGAGAQRGGSRRARRPRRAIRAGGFDRRTRRWRRNARAKSGPCRDPAARGRRTDRTRARASRRQSAARHPRRRRGDRGRLRQRRRRQIHHRGQSRSRLARSRPQGRHARCRYLRALVAQAARHQGKAADRRRHQAQTDRPLRSLGHVDRLS